MKAGKKEFETVRTLLTHLSSGGIGVDGDDQFKAWGLLNEGVHVKVANAKSYSGAVKKLYKAYFKDDYDLAELEKRIVAEFIGDVVVGSSPSDEAIADFFKKLTLETSLTRLVTRDVHGVKLSGKDAAPLSLGPFTLYFFPDHKGILLPGGSRDSLVFRSEGINYLLGISVVAKNQTRAIEKADELFEVFERIVRFMIGSNDRYDVRVMSAHGRYSRNAYVFLEGRLPTGSFSWVGAINDLPLDDPYFRNRDLGYDLLWGSIGDPACTELRKRILMSAQWLGEAYFDRTPSASFIKAAIALEVLFTASESAIVSPSILSSISENVAAILGEDAGGRIEIERKMKKYYSTRSAIAHAGKNDVDREELEEFLIFARRAIIKVMSDSTLRSLRSIEELQHHLKQLKYSFPAI